MHATPILQYLQKHGQRLDSEIATATGIPLPTVESPYPTCWHVARYPGAGLRGSAMVSQLRGCSAGFQGLFRPRLRARNLEGNEPELIVLYPRCRMSQLDRSCNV
jgi:hypothetical protein